MTQNNVITRTGKGRIMKSKIVRRLSSGEVYTTSKTTVPDVRVIGDNPLGQMAVSVIDIPQAVLDEQRATKRRLWTDGTTIRVSTVQENDVDFPAAKVAGDKSITQLFHKDGATDHVLEAAIVEFVRRMVNEGGDISSGDALQHWHDSVDAI